MKSQNSLFFCRIDGHSIYLKAAFHASHNAVKLFVDADLRPACVTLRSDCDSCCYSYCMRKIRVCNKVNYETDGPC